MQLQAGLLLHLRDSKQREMGQLTVERQEGDLLFAKFAPGPAFALVESLFHDFEEAVNGQALGVVDELDAAIAALGLHLLLPDGSPSLDVHDVQIWSDGGMTCRLHGQSQATVNGSLAAKEPGRLTRE